MISTPVSGNFSSTSATSRAPWRLSRVWRLMTSPVSKSKISPPPQAITGAFTGTPAAAVRAETGVRPVAKVNRPPMAQNSRIISRLQAGSSMSAVTRVLSMSHTTSRFSNGLFIVLPFSAFAETV